jgi:PAS domain S-box-containing protein
MNKISATKSEQGRIAALRSYDVLDTPPEQEFDNIARLAADICNAPIAFINFVDAEREWYKAAVGIELSSLPRAASFSHYTILDDELFEISNPLADSRFEHNQLVIGEAGIRFYAGIALVNSDGYRVGTLSVMSPRHHLLNSYQRISMGVLSMAVMGLLEMRLARKEAEAFKSALSAALAIAIVHDDQTIEYANDAFVQLTALTTEEVFARKFNEIKLGDLSQADQKELAAAVAEGKPWHNRIKNQNIKGLITWCDMLTLPVLNSDGTLHRAMYLLNDATDEVLAKERLDDTERLAHAGSWELNVFNRHTAWTAGMYAILGLDKTQPRPTEQSVMNFVSKEDFDKVNEVNKKLLEKSSSSAALDFRVVTADGTQKDVTAVVKKRYNNKGGLTSIYGTILDATLQQRTEPAAKEQEETLSHLYNQTALGYFSLDADGYFTDVNATVLGWLGHAKSDVVGKRKLLAFLTPSDRVSFGEAFHALQSGERQNTLTATLVAQNAESIRLVICNEAVLTEEGKFAYCNSSAINVANQATKGEQAGNLSSSIPHLMTCEVDASLSIVRLSEPLVLFTGYSDTDRHEVYGFVFDATWREHCIAAFSAQLANKEPYTTVRIQLHNKQSEHIWVEVGSYLLLGAEGDVTGLAQLFFDINHHVSTEESLREVAVMAMEAKDRHLGMIAQLSERVADPLKAVMGMVNLLATTPLSPEQKVLLDAVKETNGKVVAAISDIGDHTQLRTTPVGVAEQDFDIKALLKALVNGKKEKIASSGVRFVLHIDNKIPTTITADKEKLSRILNYIIDYILSHIAAGNLKVGVLQREAGVGRALLDCNVTVDGVEPTVVQTLLQAANWPPSAMQQPITAIGLAGKMVELLGARLQIKTHGQSSITFSFGYPTVIKSVAKAAQQAALSAGAPIGENQSLAGYLILFVEDNIMSQRVGKATLEKWGALVTVADRGNVAIELLQQRHFDLIVMDLQMPEMSGIEATLIIRNDLKIETPILAMTVSEMQTKRDACIKAGMDDYILKPLKSAELHKKIMGLLHRGDSRQSEKITNIDYIKSVTNNDTSLMREVLEIYVTRTPDLVAEIEQDISAGNYVAAQSKVHYLKNSVGLLGADSLFHMIAAVEELLNYVPPTKETLHLIATMRDTVLESVQETNQELKLL